MRADGVPLNALEVPAGSFWDGEQVTSTLDASVGTKRQTMPEKARFMAALVPWTPSPAVADPITANEGSTYTHEGSRNFRLHNVVGHAAAFTAKDHGQDAAEDLSPTLRSGTHAGSHANGGVMPAVAFKASHFTRGKDGAPSEVHPPLTADADKGDQDPVVLAFQNRPRGDDGRGYAREAPATDGVAGTLETVKPWLVAGPRMLVRRLMPTECELLQGFSKGHTLVPYRGKPMADGPRYKMLGNSWAVPNVRWIGERMDLLERLCPSITQR